VIIICYISFGHLHTVCDSIYRPTDVCR